ncbi:SpaA isopeptide-forming pilin-related protein [Gemmiger formicilis]|uniref:SpaA isopeptide-forming pilin-related protein n=1 Tax=Gemmiger formicilis TaxID=745368 RepID=UPI00352141E2
MTKAFSILHRAAALLVALCLLVGMALPVYAAEDGALFFDAGSETIPTIPAANTSSEGVEPAQEPIVSDLETIPDEGDTPPTANEPGTEAGDTVNNTAAVPNNDGKTQEAAENQTPAADTDTAPADPALTNKTPADTSDTAAAPNHAINAEETTAAKTNTEQDVLFADGDNPNEEDTMPADDSPDNDDANTPDTIADTSVSTGFIPATTTIYFEDDGRYDSKYNGNCTMRFLGFTGNSYINKVMVDTGTTVTGKDEKIHKIFSIALNSADYPAGGFYRIAFQYYDGNNNNWQEEINAFGKDNASSTDELTAIDLLAGKKFVREGITSGGNDGKHFNQNQPYNPAQWTRVEYYYKDTPLYFKNASGTALTNVTATFYKLVNGAPAQTGIQTIGTVDAGKLAAQQIRIPDNDSRFVQFTWNNGQSALYDFTTDFTTSPYADAQKLDLTAANCYVYNDTTSTWASAGGDLLTAGKKIYFDATLSAYSYEGEGLQQSAMGDGETMYCFLTSSDGAVTQQPMTQEKPDSTAAERKLWSCEIPGDGKTYTAVQFSATDNQNAPAKDNKTRKYSTAEIPPALQDPCFFADDGDPSAYTGGEGVNRDGYWGEKASVRDAESGKNTTVVDIDNSGTFTQQKDTKYITSTLYDYYTDYELNGLNRDTYSWVTTSSQRGYVTFEQFNRALSSAYTANGNVKYPLYTGHFQKSGWGDPFATVAAGMGLYGWGAEGSSNYNIFMAVNNSALDDNGNGSSDYNRTFQGLVESKTSDGTANGLPLLRTKNSNTNASVDPHFDKDFLQGKNAFNTVLGKVYEDVSFPLKQKAVFAQDPNNPSDNDPESKAEYWYYDSSKSSLYLKQNQTDGKYYLESPKGGDGNPTTDSKSQNISSPNNTNGTYGFFPFNQTVSTVGASQYNYGFGAKLQFDFTLTEDGKVVVGKDTSGRNIEVPIKFFFSGDDDVWVYIDGELMLDVGGAHGKASGLLEFGADSTVTPYVSSNKNTDSNDTMVYKGYGSGETTKTVNYNGQPITFNKKSTTKTLKKQSTHTLTMFYMERGMWESNMAVAFNFPDHNELQVEKQVDVSDVNPLFQESFKNQKIFTFNIQNLATHYEAKATDEPAIETYKLPDTVYSSATGLLSYESSLPEGVGTGSAVLWSSDKSDPSSLYRDQRRGTLTLDSAINISPYSYLTFDVYVQGKQTDTCALSNLYVELWDTSGKQMGCLGTKGLQSSDVYGAATALHPGTWYSVRLMLNSLKQVEGFDKTQLKSITVGDNYARSIYLRNFTFSSAPTLPKQTGFTTAQYNVPDYGSAESGKLENAAYAVFSSNLGNGDVVDENGRFLLQDGETVTFNDQFRRGSYIALQEQIDTELYDTTWTVYENDVPVTNVSGKADVVTTGSVSTLQNISGTAPNDGRTEKAVDATLDGHNTKNEYTEAKKPSTALVFRSYSSSADDNELTKLKVVFNNKVKTGKLIIRKVPAEDETLEGQEFTFTVRFGDVGGQSLGNIIPPKEYTCTVENHNGEYYGEIVIDKIPVGTRFVVWENEQTGTSLKSVSFNGGKDCAVAADGVKVYGAIAEGEANAATATFENTARELIDITVKKEWKKQDGTTSIPQADLPNAIYLQLQRTETPNVANSWQKVSGYESVELKKPDGYEGWTKQFTGLDKYDASKTGQDRKPYTYRVLESATKTGQFYGGAADDVIEISGKKYKVLNTTRVTGDSTNKTLTLTNQLQDAKYNLVITKQDAQDNSIKLGGVEFKLEKLNDSGAAETTYNGVTGSDSTNQGKCSFASLTPGSYRLTETKTAEGYTLLAEPIEFTLTADGQCLRDGAAFGAKTTDADGVYNIALTIYNRKGFTLPHTGADAPSLWLLIGLPALVAVLLVLVFRYNKKGGRRS